MRFLTSFLSLLFFFLVLLGVGFYFTREYLLYRGVENFKKVVLDLRRNSNVNDCANKVPDLLGVIAPTGNPQVQLRFTSDSEYVLEIICPGYEFEPIEVSEGKLDDYVTKTPGSSGIIMGEARTGVELVVFRELQQKINEWLERDITYIQKTNTVVLENSQFIVVQPGETLGSGPLTSCQGYGYQCCQPETHIGVGNKIDGLQGCETTCYSACATRPFVLSFTSNPFFDVKNRTVTVSNGESIDFTYTVDQGASDAVQVFVDFGDGSSDQSLEKTGMVSHSYQCQADSCEYTAQVRVTDDAGVESAWTETSRINVVVTR